MFPEANNVIDPTLFANPFAPMKDHLTTIIQEQHHIQNRDRPDYNEEITQRKYYSSYYAKLIVQTMVSHNAVPEEFFNILEEFFTDLSRKIPKY